MPELPEVEILRKGLTEYILGFSIADVEVRTKKIFEGNSVLVIGGRVKSIRRFGKILTIDLSNGKSLAVHVKMTGRLIYRGRKLPRGLEIEPDLLKLPNKHTHVVFTFTNGDKLYYNDVRKFGWIKIITTSKLKFQSEFVAKLGPEPFKDLTLEKFREILNRYKQPIKILLMDQSRISGV